MVPEMAAEVFFPPPVADIGFGSSAPGSDPYRTYSVFFLPKIDLSLSLRADSDSSQKLGS